MLQSLRRVMPSYHAGNGHRRYPRLGNLVSLVGAIAIHIGYFPVKELNIIQPERWAGLNPRSQCLIT